MPNIKPRFEGCNDARTGMPFGMPKGAICVQKFDDSLNSAIHITYRISLRSSSMPEPRDPLLKVLTITIILRQYNKRVLGSSGRHRPAKASGHKTGLPKQQWYCKQRVGIYPKGHVLSNDPSAGSPTERVFDLHHMRPYEVRYDFNMPKTLEGNLTMYLTCRITI